jgi:hypothetical protein
MGGIFMKPPQSQSPNLLKKGRGTARLLLVLALPLLLGAWNITMNKGINASYVERIKDGKTKKSEILTLFGDPQETKRTPEGLIFVYKTYITKEKSVSWKDKGGESKTAAAVDSPYSLEQTLKRKPKEGPTQEVTSSLTIFFGSDGETVQSHDFKQY